ncbi:hypothetical protein [Spirosoma pollinicola]|uniref:IrrE N-terminal-like domain-containing protein n=1 Tax=Spirosoma pollinicola TaxID=2057025 RepID=A0A2K8YX09_9BACT|nr:hypothetical protein [Spirosoma pollinicola]AUD02161.1 hypothetical protein CWM47_10210 [Spirosoma pollinicola]
MANSTPLNELRLIVKDIVDIVGREKAYSTVNNIYTNAPAFKHLDEDVIIQELVDRISKKYGQGKVMKVIIMEDAGIEDRSINGMYATYPHNNSIYIVINATMNYCWKKFTVLKELFHVYMDFNDEISRNVKIVREHNYRISLEKVFEETIKFKDFDFSSLEDLYDMDEEMCIVLLATELIIPIYDREEVMKMVLQIGQQPVNLTVNDIAKSMLIPEYIFQKYIDMKAVDCNPRYTEIN